METAVVVEVVPVAEKTNVPVRKEREAAAKSRDSTPAPAVSDKSASLSKAAPKPKVAPPAAEPPPTPKAAIPAPSAEPAPKASVQKTSPNSEPASLESKPDLDAARPKRKPESDRPARKPEPEPAPPASFASVLKTVEELRQKSPSKGDEPGKASEQAASDEPSRSRSTDYQASEPVTMSEIDLVRRQIERCWNLPAGARGVENMVVSIHVEMNIDGTPGVASIVEQDRVRGDPAYRAAAESALRAVLNPRCHPFGLPKEKYDSWKTITLVFDPKEMFGT